MTIFGLHISMAVVWLIIMIIFLAIEASTVGLTCIWFAAGSLVALLLALFNVPVIAQIIVFLIVSICLLVFTRKIFVEKLKTGKVDTNADALIGEMGEVISKIEPLHMGQVRAKGQVWSAICKEDIVIDEGVTVKIRAIEGVKLIVKPVDDK